MLSRRLSIFALLCCLTLPAAARRPHGIAYFDVDRLYDTIPALFYDDSDFTPQGRLGWNTPRYQRKIQDVAAVVDSLALDIVALWGVENEQVVRDLANAVKSPYVYLHRTLNSLDGLDFALLYYGDRFFPGRVVTLRRALCIEGEWNGRRVVLALCADPRVSGWIVERMREEFPGAALLLLGRSDISHPERLGLRDATAAAARAGRGNLRTDRSARWQMRDRMLVDTAMQVVLCDVYARRFLIDQRRGTPRATYVGKTYRGGVGQALPVYLYAR